MSEVPEEILVQGPGAPNPYGDDYDGVQDDEA
jgi:hypothetical protein